MIWAIEWNKRLQEKQLQLVNMFYLGQLLEKGMPSPGQRDEYARRLSVHYRTAAIRLFYIFEAPGVAQLMKAENITMTNLRNLSIEEHHDLVQLSNEIFQRG